MAGILDAAAMSLSTTTKGQDGVLQWANSIRYNMSNDSGRQLFQQQVHTHGFLFLDDYLEDILSGAKQDPLIELVKTPGRRKAIGKKPKLGSKLGNPISFSLESEAASPAKASASLVSASVNPDATAPVSLAGKKKSSPQSRHNDEEKRMEPSETHKVPPSLPRLHSAQPTLAADNLSIIAEDDESNISVVAEAKPPETQEHQHDAEANGHVCVPSEASKHERQTSIQSLQLNSPSEYHSAQATPKSPTFSSHQISMDPSLIRDVESSEPTLKAGSPNALGPASLPEEEMDVVDMKVPLKDEDTSTKANILSIPSLPEPSALRKSIRTMRDPSMGATLTGAATPGPGKRTSWLIKAREVKALDTTSKNAAPSYPSTTPGVAAQTTSHGLMSTKRKSGDVSESLHEADSWESQERNAKASKNLDGDVAPLKSQPKNRCSPAETTLKLPPKVTEHVAPSPQGVLDRLKKTVEGFGARVGVCKVSDGSPEESDIAHTFAEAKAAAEARIAERNFKEDETIPPTTASVVPTKVASENRMDLDDSHSKEAPRMSMSDLFPTGSRIKEKHKVPEKPFTFSSLASKPASRESTSTTPPNSPPPIAPVTNPTAPVFTKPVPVFVPPVPASRPLPSPPAKEYNLQTQRAFSAQPSLGLGLATSPTFGFKVPVPLTAQSTVDSLRSESIFDKIGDAPTWVPSTQDTEYTSAYGSQSQGERDMDICDEDDSWPVDEKLAAGVQWTFGGGMSKEDSMTWSTLPSQSQRGDTGPLTKSDGLSLQDTHAIPGAFDVEMNGDDVESDIGDHSDGDLEEIVLSAAKSNARADAKSFRPQSQMSMASSSSSQSQSQGGFLNQASKLLSSALGTSKKKPEVKKVLQMAAVAAKKQQEESDKKAARLKEMEIRRQAAVLRKAEEERAKVLEEERKMKEEMERRKREREEMTDKRPLKPITSKKEEELPKLKKPEPERKTVLKKTVSSGTLGKPPLKPTLKPSSTFSSFTAPSNAAASSSKTNAEGSKLPKSAAAGSLKGKSKQPPVEDEVSQPSQLLHGQMAARAKAQMKAAKQAEAIPSEAIELPDINSEYSDSEDEDRPRTFDPPEWAQSPELKQALELQSTINPDDIFGAVRPLKMEEIFRTRTSRFRARTSSANWTGTDMLTMAEERDYAKRMGFK